MKADFICTKCGKRERADTVKPRCECGGLWGLDYAPPAWDEALLDRNAHGVFRYRAFMPDMGEAWRDVTLGEGGTPIVRLDENVLLKLDCLMPTLSYKDRGAAALVAHMADMGVTRAVQDSSGNAGNSMAAYCARAGIACDVYVPEGASPGKIAMIRAHGASCIVVSGSRDHCADVCRERAFSGEAYYASHVFNPFFYEGTKTYVYEAFERLGRLPENMFFPIGNGTLFIGAMKAIKHLAASGALKTLPRIFAVQGENCAPLYGAYKKGLCEPEPVMTKKTLAEGIAIGAPARGAELMGLIRECNVTVCLAPEDMILPARERLAHRGIFAEHTSAAIYAAYLAYIKDRGEIGETLIPITGVGLKSEH